ncbi:MAG TPA: hypothetical protein VL981_04240 [Candidatus Methylacidiphilales bacterium]|nr:hypothetical protein [Candidatus Methylacidiphilales bacterium]
MGTSHHLEVAKARIEEEKKAIAAARKVGWAVKKGTVTVNEAVKSLSGASAAARGT